MRSNPPATLIESWPPFETHGGPEDANSVMAIRGSDFSRFSLSTEVVTTNPVIGIRSSDFGRFSLSTEVVTTNPVIGIRSSDFSPHSGQGQALPLRRIVT